MRRALPLLLVAGFAVACGTHAAPPAPSGAPYQVAIPTSRLDASTLLANAPLVLAIRNVGTRSIPDVTVTLNSLRSGEPTPGDQTSDTPAFLLVSAPAGAATGDPRVFALGRLAPGRTAVLRATVRAERTGPYRIDYTVSSDPNDTGIVQRAGRPAAGTLVGLIVPSVPNA
jgi:hypothetical protein